MMYAGNGLYEFEVNGQKVLLTVDDLKNMLDKVETAESDNHNQGKLEF